MHLASVTEGDGDDEEEDNDVVFVVVPGTLDDTDDGGDECVDDKFSENFIPDELESFTIDNFNSCLGLTTLRDDTEDDGDVDALLLPLIAPVSFEFADKSLFELMGTGLVEPDFDKILRLFSSMDKMREGEGEGSLDDVGDSPGVGEMQDGSGDDGFRWW